MAISLFLILFGLLWTIAGMRVCKKLYDKVRNEDHQERGKVIQRIMKTYAMAQLVSWPLVMISGWFLHVNKTLFRFVEPFVVRYLIITLRCFYSTFRGYIGFNSLIIAACRYCFIVKDSLVSRIGIERTRYIFLTTSSFFLLSHDKQQ